MTFKKWIKKVLSQTSRRIPLVREREATESVSHLLGRGKGMAMGQPYHGSQTPATAKAGQTSGFKGPSVNDNNNKSCKYYENIN